MENLNKIVKTMIGMILLIFIYSVILFGIWHILMWVFNFSSLGWWTCVGIEALILPPYVFFLQAKMDKEHKNG